VWQPTHPGSMASSITETMIQHAHVDIQAFLPAIIHHDATDHVPEDMMPDLRHVHNAYSLPNVTSKLISCCFSHNSIIVRNADPIVHVLSKAWPMRCSVRNFNDIISNYILTVPSVHAFLFSILQCCLMGRFPMCTVQMNFDAMRVLYKYFVLNPISRQEFASWVTNEHQHIVFVALKEYMVFVVSNVPGLESVLSTLHPWERFTVDVLHQANLIRERVNANASSGTPIFQSVCDGIQSLRTFKCKHRPTSFCSSSNDILAIFRSHATGTANIYNTPLRRKIYEFTSGDIRALFDALDMHGEDVDIIMEMYNTKAPARVRNMLARSLRTGSFQRSFILSECIHAVLFKNCVRSYQLPSVLVEQQRKALLKTPRQTTIHVCMCCRSIRSFVVDESTASKNVWACGSSKVLLDDRTGKLYCGRRIDKVNSMARNVAASECVSSSQRKNYWKTQNNMMCRYSELLSIDMMGKMLEFFSTLYMLCPCCMCLMIFKCTRFEGGNLKCVHCKYTASAPLRSSCYHCYQDVQVSTQCTLSGKDIVLCKVCDKPWVINNEIMSRLSDDDFHRAINERWTRRRLEAHLGIASASNGNWR